MDGIIPEADGVLTSYVSENHSGFSPNCTFTVQLPFAISWKASRRSGLVRSAERAKIEHGLVPSFASDENSGSRWEMAEVNDGLQGGSMP